MMSEHEEDAGSKDKLAEAMMSLEAVPEFSSLSAEQQEHLSTVWQHYVTLRANTETPHWEHVFMAIMTALREDEAEVFAKVAGRDS